MIRPKRKEVLDAAWRNVPLPLYLFLPGRVVDLWWLLFRHVFALTTIGAFAMLLATAMQKTSASAEAWTYGAFFISLMLYGVTFLEVSRRFSQSRQPLSAATEDEI